MDSRIYYISVWLSWACILLLFILSLIFCYKKGGPGYLRSFPIYCFVNVFTEVLVIFHPSAKAAVYFSFTIFELCYFSFLLSKLIQGRGIVIVLWGLDGLFLCFLAHYLWRHRIIPRGMPEEGEVIILLFPCLVCYKQIFTIFINVELRRVPAFWMVTGILFYIILLFPTLLFYHFYRHMGRPDIARLYYSLNNVALIVSCLLYAKGITCW